MYKKNSWEKYENLNEVMAFSEGYKDFITKAKTERLSVIESEKLLRDAGFKSISEYNDLKTGDKVYLINKKKNIVAYVIGEKPITEGLRILGAHIDSPRIDFKENPLYESAGFLLADTHYYGGIKKYQWVTVPLSIIGVVCKKDGSVVNVSIGEDDSDPIVGISDLLVHLSADQLQKSLAKGIEGEDLDVTLGSIKLKDKEIKEYILDLLKQKYGIEEEDFITSELELVPSGKARDYGLDKSMIAGYGHDDRSCAYTSLKALIDTPKATYTTCCILVDKEEIGSVGATGAQSLFFENSIVKLLELMGVGHPVYNARIVLENSRMLSSDVSAGYDPLYAHAFEKKNASFLGQGVVFNKYTGSRGKSGSNDATPEYYAWVRNIMDKNNVNWQSAELGRVDQGGGGTIAYILGNYNMNVIDAGIPVLNMHAPMEVVSKADVFEAYSAYKVFLKEE